jgi:hypothetical protein
MSEISTDSTASRLRTGWIELASKDGTPPPENPERIQYRDETIYHVATPGFYQIGDKWYLYTQACPLPGNGNYIDGHWDLWCFACDRLIPTLPGCESIYIPGQQPAAGAGR